MNNKARFAVLLVPALVAGLWWLLSQDKPAATPNHAPVDHEIPVVAFRGQGLRQYEEPLPEGALIRIGSTRFRFPFDAHELPARQGGRFVFVSRHNGLLLIDTTTGQRVDTRLHLEKSGNFGLSPDGKRLATWSSWDDKKQAAQIWELGETLETPLTRRAYLPLEFIGDSIFLKHFFSADSTEFIVKSDRFVGIFDAATGRRKSLIESDCDIYEISRDGSRYLASANGHPQFSSGIMTGGHRVPSYGFRSPDSTETDYYRRRELAFFDRSASPHAEPYRMIIGDCRTGNQLDSIVIPRASHDLINHLELSPQGKYLSYEFWGTLNVWDIDLRKQALTLQPRFTWKMADRKHIDQTWFSADGRFFSVHESDDSERHFELQTGKEVSAERANSPRPQTWRFEPRTHPVTPEGTIQRPAGDAVSSTGYARLVMDTSADGARIAIGDAFGRIDVWQSNGRFVKSLQTRGKHVSAIAFNSDGSQLAVCDRSRNLKIWECREWKVLASIEIPADHKDLYPTALVFSPNGKNLLLGHGNILALLEIQSERILWESEGSLSDGKCSAPHFSNDGSRIMLECSVPWLDAVTGKYLDHDSKELGKVVASERVFRWDVDTSGTSTALSPDNKQSASIDGKGTMKIWDIEADRQCLLFHESTGHRFCAGSLRFSPDGRRLLTFNDRGQLHVWEIASGQLAFTLDYPNGHFADARFGVDGRTIITSNHREVIVWDLKPTTKIADPWESLGHDAPVAEQARRTLLADPKHAVDYIESRLRPAPVLDEVRISRSIALLEHKNFRERERATAELIGYGRGVLPRLKEARLASEEGKARLASLVRLLSASPTANEMRQVRGKEVLEQARFALR